MKHIIRSHRTVFLFLVLLVAAAFRLDFLIADHFVIDSDEAIVGLMAKHMLEGKGIPVFYYGQNYMGSLEAICVAALGWIAGVSSVTLKLVPFFFSLALILSTYFIAEELFGLFAARVTSVLLAVPPLTLLDWSTKARGGFIEIIFIGSLAVLVSLRIFKLGNSKFRYLVLGLILGIGWWVNNQIIYFMLPIALVLAAEFLSVTKRTADWSLRRFSEFFSLLLSGLCGFLFGSLPFSIYNLQHRFASAEIFHSAGPKAMVAHLRGFFSISLPILLGAKRFWHTEDIFRGASLIFVTAYMAMIALTLVVRFRAGAANIWLPVQRRGMDLILLLCVTVPVVFAASSFGDLIEAPRYVLPLYLGIFVLVGAGISVIRKQSAIAGYATLVAFLGLNLISDFCGGRALPGEPLISGTDRVAKDHSQLIDWLHTHDVHNVRTNYWIGYRLAFETKEDVRFLVFNEPHRVRISEYESNVNSEFERWHTPIVAVPSQADRINRGLKRLGYNFSRERVGSYVVFSNFESDLEGGGIEKVPKERLLVSASNHSEAAQNMLDGSTFTRWGTAGAQKRGMSVTVNLTAPTELTAIHYVIGEWITDWPRKMEVDFRDPDGNVSSLGLANSYADVSYTVFGEPDVWLKFAPRRAAAVIFRELGESSVFDWSIAELEFYGPRDGRLN